MNGSTDSKAQSILTVLAALSARRVTGTLRYATEQDGEFGIEFLFREGKLLFATSTHPGERTAEFLVRRNAISGADAKNALKEAKRQKKLFHAYLAEAQVVSHELLQDLLYQRTEELLDDILKTDGGSVVFQPKSLEELDHDVPGVDEELFGRLLKHRNVWPSLYEQFRDPHLVLRIPPGVEKTSAFQTLTEGEHKLLSLIDGTRSVSQILARRKNRIDLMVLLARFLDSRLVTPVGVETGTEDILSDSLSALEDAVVAAPPLPMAPPSSPAPTAPEPAAAGLFTGELSLQNDPSAGDPSSPLSELTLSVTDIPAATTVPQAPTAPSTSQPAPTAKQPLKPSSPVPAANSTPLTHEQFDLVPVLSQSMDIAKMSLTGLMMDDLFLLSQVNGRSTVRELLWVTQISEEKMRKTMGRLLQAGYLTLHSRAEAAVLAADAAAAKAPAKEVAGAPPAKPATPTGAPRSQAPPAAGVAKTKPSSEGSSPASRAADAAMSGGRQLFQELYVSGMMAYNEARYQEAERHLRQALGMNPRAAAVRARLAVVLLERAGQERLAQKMADEAFDEDPLLGQCLEAKGIVALKLGEYAEARRLLEQAILLDKQSVPAAAKLLTELKNRPPGKKETVEDYWWKVHRGLRLMS